MKFKSLIAVLATVFCLNASAATTIEVFGTVMPNDKVTATFGPYRDQVIDFLRGVTPIGNLPAERTAPNVFALANTFTVNDIMASDTAPLYNGVLNPAVNGEQRGSRVGFPVRIVSSEPFAASRVRIVVRSSDSFNSLAFVPAITTYSPEFRGLYYGADGVKGNGDDVVRVSGSTDEPVNETYYVGAGVAYAANDQAAIDNIRGYVAGLVNFTITAEITLVRADNSVIATATKTMSLGAPQGRLAIRKLANGTSVVTVIQQGGINVHLLEASTPSGPWTHVSEVKNGDEVVIGGNANRFFRTRQ